jgi:hypothetical protein
LVGKPAKTRDYCVAKNATHRAVRPDPSLRKERLRRMTIKLHYYLICQQPVGSGHSLSSDFGLW